MAWFILHPFFLTLVMTIQEALVYGRFHLHATSPSPALDARLLLQHILQVNHAYLIAHHDETLTAVAQQTYLTLLHRAQTHEPIPYLLGSAPCFGLDFHVTPAVLIPRPETEHLIERAIAWAKNRPAPTLVDVGTGSGCIAISLAHHLPQARIYATDISPAALAVAQENAARLTPGRITFYQGDLLLPLPQPVDLILANLPYVTDQEWTALDDGVKLYEPAVALKGGHDGLDVIQRLLHQATARLNPGGTMMLEIGWQQGKTAHHLAQTIWPAAQIQLLPDFAGHDRIVEINTTR